MVMQAAVHIALQLCVLDASRLSLAMYFVQNISCGCHHYQWFWFCGGVLQPLALMQYADEFELLRPTAAD